MVNKKTELKLAIACLFLAAAAALFIGCPIPHPPPPPPPPPATVTLDVCPASGLLPNPYCPVNEKRTFEKGKEPTTQCGVHQPPPPPPVELRKTLWVAAYDLFGATGDRERFIRAVADTGATGIRIFYLYAWGSNVASPWKQIGTWRAGYPDAPELPFYDLDQDNPAYWETFRAVHRLMKELGLTVYGVLDDFCSLKVGGWPKYRHPVLSSRPDRDMNDPEVNRLPGGYWGMGPGTIQRYHAAYFARVVQELKTIGVKYYLEVHNEADALDWPEEYFVSWHKWAVETLNALCVPKDRIIASSGRAWKAIADQVGIYSLHGYVRPENVPDWQYDHTRILISGDGGFDGEGRPDARGRKGISPDQAEAMALKILTMDYAGYEYLDRGLYLGNNDRANLDNFQIEPLIRMINVLKK